MFKTQRECLASQTCVCLILVSFPQQLLHPKAEQRLGVSANFIVAVYNCNIMGGKCLFFPPLPHALTHF